jgi:hypothetical protein
VKFALPNVSRGFYRSVGGCMRFAALRQGGVNEGHASDRVVTVTVTLWDSLNHVDVWRRCGLALIFTISAFERAILNSKQGLASPRTDSLLDLTPRFIKL